MHFVFCTKAVTIFSGLFISLETDCQQILIVGLECLMIFKVATSPLSLVARCCHSSGNFTLNCWAFNKKYYCLPDSFLIDLTQAWKIGHVQCDKPVKAETRKKVKSSFSKQAFKATRTSCLTRFRCRHASEWKLTLLCLSLTSLLPFCIVVQAV